MSNPNFDTVLGTIGTTNTLNISAIKNSKSVKGYINSSLDADFYSSNLDGGELYQITVIGRSGLDPTLGIRNSSNVQIAFNDDTPPNLNSLLLFQPPASGTFYLDAGGFGTSLGGYRITIREVPDDVGTYSSIIVGGSVTGVIGSFLDQDWHKMQLVAGQSYIFDAIGGTLPDPTLTLRNAAGAQIAFDDDGGFGAGDSRIIFTAPASGTYFLDVGGSGASAGAYTLTARVDDVADDIATIATAVAVSSSQTGVVNSAGDQDYYKIQLSGGVLFLAAVNTDASWDPTLGLRDANGTLLASDDNGGNGSDSLLVYTPPVTGFYFLDVGGAGSSTGDYTLVA